MKLSLKCAAQDDPANTDAYMYLGQLYYAQGKYPQAIEQFLKIVQLDPANTSAFIYWDQFMRTAMIIPKP